MRNLVAEASAAGSSGKGLFAPGIKCVIFVLSVWAMIRLTVAPFETRSTQVVGHPPSCCRDIPETRGLVQP